MSSKDLEFLLENNVNIYKLLDIPKDANSDAIRRAYRKLALIYHPDKNPTSEAAEIFHHSTLALNVLSDVQLRNQYDNWVNAREAELIRTAKLDNDRRRMKDELETAERESNLKTQPSHWAQRKANKSSDISGLEIERLREEGARKRRKFEADYLSKLETNSKQPSDPSSTQKLDANRTVKVRWKIKKGVLQYLGDDILSGMLSIFGEVESVQMLERSPNEERYGTAVVVFKTYASASSAVSEDFMKKPNIWENTYYKRLSRLLRQIKWLTKISPTEKLDSKNLSFEDYRDLTINKLRNYKLQPLKP